MPKPAHRSRSLRKVFRKVPSRTTVHYRKRKPQKAKCGSCGAVLKGVPRERPYKMQRLSKNKKRPSRPYGGILCNKCMREDIKKEARQ